MIKMARISDGFCRAKTHPR